MTEDKTTTVTNNVNGRGIIPFTGVFFAIWAFFGPESYGYWLGSIVRGFRAAAGL